MYMYIHPHNLRWDSTYNACVLKENPQIILTGGADFNLQTVDGGLTALMLASSLGLHILQGWKTKVWYTLFAHAYNFNKNSVKPFISEQIRVLFMSLSRSGQWRLLFVLCLRSCLYLNASPTLQTLCLKISTLKEQLRSAMEAIYGEN